VSDVTAPRAVRGSTRGFVCKEEGLLKGNRGQNMKKNNFSLAIRITWGVILLSAIALAMTIKIYLMDDDRSGSWFFLVYSIPLLMSSFILIMFLYNLKRAYIMGEKEIEQGKRLVCWQYPEEEWERFNLEEWKKTRKKSILIPLGVIVLFYLIFWADSDISADDRAVIMTFIGGFLGALGAILFYYTHAMYRRSRICPREVIIGPHGLLYGGFFNTWEAIGTRLGGVKLIPGDIPIMEFDVRVWARYGSNSQKLRIPVPRGHEGEAEDVIRKLAS
jgi:hypothetical protein